MLVAHDLALNTFRDSDLKWSKLETPAYDPFLGVSYEKGVRREVILLWGNT